MQETWVRSLVRKDPTCHGAAEPRLLSPRPAACALQQEKLQQRETGRRSDGGATSPRPERSRQSNAASAGQEQTKCSRSLRRVRNKQNAAALPCEPKTIHAPKRLPQGAQAPLPGAACVGMNRTAGSGCRGFPSGGGKERRGPDSTSPSPHPVTLTATAGRPPSPRLPIVPLCSGACLSPKWPEGVAKGGISMG